MNNLKHNIYIKIGAILFIGALLMIPAKMIEGMIYEREATQKEAINEVSDKWGKEQRISGPYISIPYTKTIREYSNEENQYKTWQEKDFIHILPNELSITGNIDPEPRNRGIYEVVVYNSKLNFSGKFSKLDLQGLDIPLEDIHLDKAFLTVGINDLRGIERQIDLTWNGRSYLFNPGVESNDLVGSGLNAELNLSSVEEQNYDFSFDLDLKGSQLLYFTPLGKVTDVKITSSWKDPSFNGAFLPDLRKVTQTGFVANWNVLHLNRNYPQRWIGNKHSISESEFGIDLLIPVDNYQKSLRSIKYAILFLGLTFLTFFFIEIMNKVFIHPIQYILVGIALIVFYTLLLSVSEHMSYNSAFILSASATLILIATYVRSILKSGKLSLLISGILLILYTFIFVIIQLEDFALLIGSIGIFLILGLVMFYSRKIDWYNIGSAKSQIEHESED